MRDRRAKPKGVFLDFGTSPHGLSAELQLADQETRSADNLHSLVDGFDLAAVAAAADSGVAASAVAAGQLPRFHYLELTDGEFALLVAAVEKQRYKTLEHIEKGKAIEADLEGSPNSLWQKLQEIRALQMRKEYGGWL